MRGRPRRTTWLYDDPDHADRVTGTVEAPDWTDEDRAALLGLQQYESTLCPGCGHPKQTAWHSDMSGWWKAERFVCLACTESEGGAQERVYAQTFVDPMVDDIDDLSPLRLGGNTVTPSEGGDRDNS